jgi:hypothetical protein
MTGLSIAFRHRERPDHPVLFWEGAEVVPHVGDRIRRDRVTWLVIEVTWHSARDVEVLVGDRGDPTTEIRAGRRLLR